VRLAVVGVDRALDLEVTRPAIDRNETEPEFLLRGVVEEGAPALQVPLAEPWMGNREPRGGLGRVVARAAAPHGGVGLRGQDNEGEQNDHDVIHGCLAGSYHAYPQYATSSGPGRFRSSPKTLGPSRAE